MRLRGTCAFLALTALAHGGRGQPVEIVSGLGGRAEAEALEAVLRARELYAELGLHLRKPHQPTTVILLPTVVELAPYIGPETGRSRAFSFAGSDRNYAVVAWAAPGNALRAAAHEYAHLVDPLDEAPVWFREGFAEYLSYLEPDAAGRPSPALPARHVVRLRDSEWLPLARLIEATRQSPEFEAPTFYAQTWLVIHWLAAHGKPLNRLRPADLHQAAGRSDIDEVLKEYFVRLDAQAPLNETGRVAMPDGPPPWTWEVRLALAEVDRELNRWERAQSALEALAAERPEDPGLAAALGALAMDQGRYDEAESWLAAAAKDGAASARTHYRLALMLLRPSDGDGKERARQAASHARLALERFPAAPDYRIALAQALLVEGRWEDAARELNDLAVDPQWRPRAAEEMHELERRRQQALRQLEKPAIESQPRPRTIPGLPLDVSAVPKPPSPPPPPPLRWPPPGTTILAGRIDYVDCSGPEKIIKMRHPVLRLHIRERKGKPAKLFHSPEKEWTIIPCGAKGWTVNIAYYSYPNDKGLLGDAVAILF